MSENYIVTGSDGLPEFGMNLDALILEATALAANLARHSNEPAKVADLLNQLVAREVTDGQSQTYTIAVLLRAVTTMAQDIVDPLLDVAEAATGRKDFRHHLYMMAETAEKLSAQTAVLASASMVDKSDEELIIKDGEFVYNGKSYQIADLADEGERVSDWALDAGWMREEEVIFEGKTRHVLYMTESGIKEFRRRAAAQARKDRDQPNRADRRNQQRQDRKRGHK